LTTDGAIVGSTSVSVTAGGTFIIDNTQRNATRVNPNLPFSLNGGTLISDANASGSTVPIGLVTPPAPGPGQAVSTIESNAPSASAGTNGALLQSTGLVRGAGATVNFIGNGAPLGTVATTGNEIQFATNAGVVNSVTVSNTTTGVSNSAQQS